MEDNWIRVNVVGYQARLISGNGIFGNPMGTEREKKRRRVNFGRETTLIPKHP